MRNEEYMKIEDAAELLSEPVTIIKKWADEKNKALLNCNGITIEGGSVIKIDDIADIVNIPLTTIKKWVKENKRPILNCDEIPEETGEYQRIKEISERLGIPEVTIKKWVKADKIPHYWAGEKILLFNITEVVEWANNRGYMQTPIE